MLKRYVWTLRSERLTPFVVTGASTLPVVFQQTPVNRVWGGSLTCLAELPAGKYPRESNAGVVLVGGEGFTRRGGNSEGKTVRMVRSLAQVFELQKVCSGTSAGTSV